MRILIDAHMLGERETGNETYVANLIRGLHACRTDESFLLATTNPALLREQGLLAEGFEAVPVSSSPLKRLTWDLPHIVRRENVDVLHVTYTGPMAVSCPLVVSVHDVSFKHMPEWFSARDRAVLEVGVGLTLRRADRVVTISEHSRREIARYYGMDADCIAVTYLAANEAFRPQSPDAARAAVEESLGVAPPYILALGNIQPRKNLDRLVAAYARLRRDYAVEQSLVLVGQPHWRSGRIMDRIRNENLESHIHCTGYVPEDLLPAVYSAADIFVYPSLYEGFGLPILEAMACGTAVVTSNTTSLPEVAGNAAEYVDPTDIDDMARGMAAVLKNPEYRQSLAENGPRRARGFTIQKTAEETRRIYHDLAAGRRAVGAGQRRAVPLSSDGDRMRILFAHHNPDLYGSSRSLFRLTSRLVEDGHGVMVVVPEEGPLTALFERKGVNVVIEPKMTPFERLSFGSPGGVLRFLFGLPASVRRMARHIRSFQPDIVHTNTSVVLAAALAARRCRTPHVWHLREFYGEFPSFWKLYARFMLHLSSRVVCISRSVAEQFSHLRPTARVHVLYNGYPRDEYEGVTDDRVEAFRRRHGLDSTHLLVGVVGRVKIRRKGQEVFIDAASRLAASHPGARFLIIGSPFRGYESQVDTLKEMVASHGLVDRVVFTGDVDDIKAAYQALDVVVVPSALPEPFGGVIAEAMAFSKPVVSTTIGGPSEIIEDGRTGLLVAPGDAEALADAMTRLLANGPLRASMGIAGRERYLSHFTFEPFYASILSIYRSLAGSPDTNGA